MIAIPIGRLSSNEDRIGSPAQLPNRAPAIAGITSTRDHRYRSLQGGVFRGVGFIHTHAKPVTLVSTRCFRLSASTGHLSGTYTGSRGGISIPRLVFPAAQWPLDTSWLSGAWAYHSIAYPRLGSYSIPSWHHPVSYTSGKYNGNPISGPSLPSIPGLHDGIEYLHGYLRRSFRELRRCSRSITRRALLVV